jgi:hypothetical protein
LQELNSSEQVKFVEVDFVAYTVAACACSAGKCYGSSRAKHLNKGLSQQNRMDFGQPLSTVLSGKISTIATYGRKALHSN